MLTHNPFADLFPAALMQGYVILMVLLVLGSTIFDTIHKKSAKYFFQAAEKSKKSQTRSISGGEKTSIAVKTAVNEVMLSSEFCNARRRIAHLLGMYGFVMFFDRHNHFDLFISHVSDTCPSARNGALAYWRVNGRGGRLLVLVLYPC